MHTRVYRLSSTNTFLICIKFLSVENVAKSRDYITNELLITLFNICTV